MAPGSSAAAAGSDLGERPGVFVVDKNGLVFVATITSMKIEFDPEKNAKNARERGLPFELAAELEWHKAHAFVDDRRDYG